MLSTDQLRLLSRNARTASIALRSASSWAALGGVLGRRGQRHDATGSQVGARALERARSLPILAGAQGIRKADQIDVGAGQKKRQKLAFELRIAIGEASQVGEIDYRLGIVVGQGRCSGRLGHARGSTIQLLVLLSSRSLAGPVKLFPHSPTVASSVAIAAATRALASARAPLAHGGALALIGHVTQHERGLRWPVDAGLAGCRLGCRDQLLHDGFGQRMLRRGGWTTTMALGRPSAR